MMALYHNEGRGLFIDEAPTTADRPRVAPDADLRLFLLRLRSRRPAGHLRRQRARRRRHRARAGARALRAAAASVPERRREEVRGGAPPQSSGADSSAMVGARRGLRRLRQRRRSRPRRHGQQRRRRASSATTAPARNNVLRVQTIGAASNRDGIGARVELALAGGAQTVADRQDRIELRLAERAAAHLRAGSGRRGDGHPGDVAERPRGHDRPVKANQLVVIKEGSGLLRSTPLNRGR